MLSNFQLVWPPFPPSSTTNSCRNTFLSSSPSRRWIADMRVFQLHMERPSNGSLNHQTSRNGFETTVLFTGSLANRALGSLHWWSISTVTKGFGRRYCRGKTADLLQLRDRSYGQVACLCKDQSRAFFKVYCTSSLSHHHSQSFLGYSQNDGGLARLLGSAQTPSIGSNWNKHWSYWYRTIRSSMY